MAQQAQLGICGLMPDPSSVTHQGQAAAFDIDIDATGPGIERVFHQLFDHRRRALGRLRPRRSG